MHFTMEESSRFSFMYLLGEYRKLPSFDADADFATIHDSNMSKLCKTEEEAQQTVAKYEQDFKDGKTTYDTPYYYLNEKTGFWIVKNKSTGKVLKSINYTPVKFE